jgi:hypothetical protein
MKTSPLSKFCHLTCAIAEANSAISPRRTDRGPQPATSSGSVASLASTARARGSRACPPRPRTHSCSCITPFYTFSPKRSPPSASSTERSVRPQSPPAHEEKHVRKPRLQSRATRCHLEQMETAKKRGVPRARKRWFWVQPRFQSSGARRDAESGEEEGNDSKCSENLIHQSPVRLHPTLPESRAQTPEAFRRGLHSTFSNCNDYSYVKFTWSHSSSDQSQLQSITSL